MRVAVLFAGGKDSTYATYLAMKSGHDVKYLLTMVSENPYSWMFHTVNIDITRYQAEAMEIEQVMRPTCGEKDLELEDLKEAVESLRMDIEGIVAGSVSSSYQKNRIERICKELGLALITPLWGRDPIELLREMKDAKFEIIITSVAAQGFDESWLGRKFDDITIEDLIRLSGKYGINTGGEGGDYESFVLDGPLFKKRVEPLDVEKVWLGTNGYLLIRRARIVEK